MRQEGSVPWGGVRFESIVHIRAERTVSEYRRVSQIIESGHLAWWPIPLDLYIAF